MLEDQQFGVAIGAFGQPALQGSGGRGVAEQEGCVELEHGRRRVLLGREVEATSPLNQLPGNSTTIQSTGPSKSTPSVMPPPPSHSLMSEVDAGLSSAGYSGRRHFA